MRAIDPFQEIKLTGNYRFGDIEDLNSLEEFVLKEFAGTTPGNAKLKLKKMQEVKNILAGFDKNYPELLLKSKKSLLQTNELIKYLPGFDVPNAHEMTITPEYLETIYQSVLYRQISLLALINKTEDLLAGL